ncbi:MAG: NUDIX domain-containing protein [Anaerolineae bacterium]|nr:NUDIX domain-containing protein [Anaerolineae bacterium]
MRLGTRVAVINEKNEILLSKRGDFGTWALPGGRVDSGELIHESAAREVREETGLEVKIERAVGLYYQQGRSRTNVLYRAKPIGGELLSKTDETLANQYFLHGINCPKSHSASFILMMLIRLKLSSAQLKYHN